MNARYFVAAAVFGLVAGQGHAQTLQRRAILVGGGRPDHQKCTIEVVVDGAAEVEVRGDNAVLRNLSGQPPQWRRFECTSVMPSNPAGFRFAGVDGRGRQDLVRDPRGGSPAVVRIEDRDNGAEGYTFDLFWTEGGYPGNYPSGGGSPRDDRGGFPRDDRGGFQGGDRGGFQGGDRGGFQGGGGFDRDRDYPRRGNPFTAEQAVRVCQDAVRDQAMDRFRTREVRFRRTELDNNPGRRDWVLGTLEVQRGRRTELYRFSCSVNFDSGRVRSAEIEPYEFRR